MLHPIHPESPVRYVAIGDSFTEGVGDEGPDGAPRGWADRVAAGLARVLGHPIDYANLAIRGRLLEPIVHEQLDAALALRPLPTLLSLNGGGNDVMRPGADVVALSKLTIHAVDRCVAAGVPVVLLSGADPSARLPFGPVIHRRASALTAAISARLPRPSVTFVDAFHDPQLRRPEYWSPDRLHLAAAGHARVAALVLGALGHPPRDEAVPAPADVTSILGEARYYREHVLPWFGRRIRGRSSGDGREPKHPGWTTVHSAG
ncbi:MAG TPA: SGNH/GDSL hydrolase family protein [Jatrophihabitans sp.]|nr:SGNH/GDSL hydrolase family protein [Jatrophihabitans sp.]